jgi:GNAT superfamily N-acetyltransferase
MDDVSVLQNDGATDAELNVLFSAAWPSHEPREFQPTLRHSLTYLCARHAGRLIGFVNVAWDGGSHAFLLDPTVHPDFQHRGIGTRLIRECVEVAQDRGVEWLHVDFEPQLAPFYRGAGFHPTEGGLIRLHPPQTSR